MMIEITPEYLSEQGLSPNFQERFWKKVNKLGPIPQHCPELGECWIWTGCILERRYGAIFARWDEELDRPKIIKAHIASWILHFGPVPDGLCVCHHCDVGICIRPSHLWLGTHSQNMADMVRKHRNKWFSGEGHSRSKLTWAQVNEIRATYRRGGRNATALARKFGITPGHIHDIVNGVVWKSTTSK